MGQGGRDGGREGGRGEGQSEGDGEGRMQGGNEEDDRMGRERMVLVGGLAQKISYAW